MDENTFWTMIETARDDAAGDNNRQYELMVERLSQLPVSEMQDYRKLYSTMHWRAYRGDLWAASIFILETGSDDGFMDFRAWLISQGKEIFEKALENPDSLADVVDEENRGNQTFEIFAYIPTYAYRRKTGTDDFLPESTPVIRSELAGEIASHVEWTTLFPRLTEKLGYDPDEWNGF